MTRKPKPTHRQRYQTERTLVLAGDVKDLAAARAASETDVIDDFYWLADHPQAEERRRPASPREVKAYGLAPGSHIVATRGPAGNVLHMIFPPKK